ncbi:MAG: hypothetical protein OEV64_14845, partial [Desulfobulbaceae bacterium]|nr:hypothetical protein [Desulfobulbaceae bacterium]
MQYRFNLKLYDNNDHKKITENEIVLWKKTAIQLKGTERRQFMASVVNLLRRGGLSFAERILGWN